VLPQVKAALEGHAEEHEMTVGALIESLCRRAGILHTPQTGTNNEAGVEIGGEEIEGEQDWTVTRESPGINWDTNTPLPAHMRYIDHEDSPLLSRAFARGGEPPTTIIPPGLTRRERVERAQAAQVAWQNTQSNITFTQAETQARDLVAGGPFRREYENQFVTPDQARHTIGMPTADGVTDRLAHWPWCQCGSMRIAPGTRTELAGVSHGETPCFECNTHGRRTQLAPDLHERVQNRAVTINHDGTPHQWNMNGQCALCGILNLAPLEP
jgi:hypothetical protein